MPPASNGADERLARNAGMITYGFARVMKERPRNRLGGGLQQGTTG